MHVAISIAVWIVLINGAFPGSIRWQKGGHMKRILAVAIAVGLVAAAGPGMAADSNTLTVQASVRGTCKFSSTTSILGFGTLDPSVGTDVNGSTTVQFWCTKGVTTDSITASNGNNFAGGKRGMMDTVSSEVIPYTLALDPGISPNAGPSSPRTLTITGSVLGADYTAKSAGDYSDSVTLSINP
jgi:hypothetical protein